MFLWKAQSSFCWASRDVSYLSGFESWAAYQFIYLSISTKCSFNLNIKKQKLEIHLYRRSKYLCPTHPHQPVPPKKKINTPISLSLFFPFLCLFRCCVVGISPRFACFLAERALSDLSFAESSLVSFFASSSSSEGLRDGARVRRCLCGGSQEEPVREALVAMKGMSWLELRDHFEGPDFYGMIRQRGRLGVEVRLEIFKLGG